MLIRKFPNQITKFEPEISRLQTIIGKDESDGRGGFDTREGEKIQSIRDRTDPCAIIRHRFDSIVTALETLLIS